MDLLCRACGTQNRPGRKFCAQCAAPLGVTCGACGTPNEPDERFCGNCAAALDSSLPASVPPHPAAASNGGSPPVAERRVCSVLFVDLVGFTPLSESMDPEDVRGVLSRYFESASTVIARYGGVIEKFIGDAVMAVWGTPVAFEGDAERAVRAAIDVLAAVAELADDVGARELQARAGVVTGEVAVTLGATGQGMAAGDTVNTAARVQTAAEPGSVWVDAATHRLAGHGIGFADVGEHELKGKREPVRLWRATRVLSNIGGAQRVDGLEAPMLGRDPELRLVKDLFHAAADRRSPRLVVVTGPAGVGKSRLGWEFEKYIDGLAKRVFWHRGRCLSYGDGVAFWALAEVIRQRLGIAEDDLPENASAKVSEGLEAFVDDPDERAYIAQRVNRLLGIPGGDAGAVALDRDELFAGWRLFFERLASRQPVTILVEDAQYADEGLIEFLNHLVDWARDAPIFVLVFARPEIEDTRPGFGVGRNRTTLALDPLDRRSMDTLLDALVPGLSDSARERISAQSQGIPLFAVETIRTLIDRAVVVPLEGEYRLVGDVGDLSVPDSLHGLLAARLDALDHELRGLVADASVLGGAFSAEALVAVSGRPVDKVEAGLRELVRREVLHVSSDPLSPEQGSYQFSQNMLRQVAYATLSKPDRKRRHLAVASHLRGAFASDGEEVSEVIAQHYRDALEAGPSDSDAADVRAKAIHALRRAAERAVRSGAPSRAASSFAEAALLTGPEVAQDSAQLLEAAAAAASTAGAFEWAVELADRAAALYASASDDRAVARLGTVAGRALRQLGRYTDARHRLERAIEVLRPQPDHDTVDALAEYAVIQVFATDSDVGKLTSEALALGIDLDVNEARLAGLFITRGLAHQRLNQAPRAVANLEYAVRLAERSHDSAQWGRALLNLASCQLAWEPEAAARTAQAGIAQARRIGAASLLSVSLFNRVLALLGVGKWDTAQESLDDVVRCDGLEDGIIIQGQAWLSALRGRLQADEWEAAAAGRSSEDPQDISANSTIVAVAAAGAGDAHRALRGARAALEHVSGLGLQNEAVLWSWPVAADMAHLLADDAALDHVLSLLDAHPIGHVPPLLRAERELALARRAGRTGDDSASSRFTEAIEAVRRCGSPYHLAHGLIDQGEFLRKRGDEAAAGALVSEAAVIAEQLGARPLRERSEAAGATGGGVREAAGSAAGPE